MRIIPPSSQRSFVKKLLKHLSFQNSLESPENKANLAPSLVAILGGTFDPIHWGHLLVACQLSEVVSFQSIRFMPSNQPPHRAPPRAAPAQRLKMVELAVREASALAGGYPFEVERLEVERGGVSYTANSLEALDEREPEKIKCFILGADSFLTFLSWERWETILSHAHLIIVNRPGTPFFPDSALKELLQARQVFDVKALRTNHSGCIYFQTIKPLDISSTKIRAILKDNEKSNLEKEESLRAWLPNTVYRFIKEEKIYLD